MRRTGLNFNPFKPADRSKKELDPALKALMQRRLGRSKREKLVSTLPTGRKATHPQPRDWAIIPRVRRREG